MRLYYAKERNRPSQSELRKAFTLLWKFIEWFELNVSVSDEVDADIRNIKDTYYRLRDRLGV